MNTSCLTLIIPMIWNSWINKLYYSLSPLSSHCSLSLPCHCPHLSAVITRLDRVISLPLLPIFRMPRSSRSIHLLLTSSQQSCLGFLYSVMPRLDRGISRLFPCHLLSHPPGTARPGNWNSLVPREQTAAGELEFACSAWTNCRRRVLPFHSKNHAVFNLTFPRVRPVENRRNTIKSK